MPVQQHMLRIHQVAAPGDLSAARALFAEFVVYCPGDADCDGWVDVQDYLAYKLHAGTSGAGWAGGDFNGDGQVDGADLAVLDEHFGESIWDAPAPPADDPPPEANEQAVAPAPTAPPAEEAASAGNDEGRSSLSAALAQAGPTPAGRSGARLLAQQDSIAQPGACPVRAGAAGMSDVLAEMPGRAYLASPAEAAPLPAHEGGALPAHAALTAGLDARWRDILSLAGLLTAPLGDGG